MKLRLEERNEPGAQRILAELGKMEALLLERLAKQASPEPVADAMATAAGRARLWLVREMRQDWFGESIIESEEQDAGAD
jgi:hypothetical protein